MAEIFFIVKAADLSKEFFIPQKLILFWKKVKGQTTNITTITKYFLWNLMLSENIFWCNDPKTFTFYGQRMDSWFFVCWQTLSWSPKPKSRLMAGFSLKSNFPTGHPAIQLGRFQRSKILQYIQNKSCWHIAGAYETFFRISLDPKNIRWESEEKQPYFSSWIW